MITIAPINIEMHWTNDGLPTHVPKKSFAHHPLNGRQPKDSLEGSSLKWNPFKGPPFNPLVDHLDG